MVKWGLAGSSLTCFLSALPHTRQCHPERRPAAGGISGWLGSAEPSLTLGNVIPNGGLPPEGSLGGLAVPQKRLGGKVAALVGGCIFATFQPHPQSALKGTAQYPPSVLSQLTGKEWGQKMNAGRWRTICGGESAI